MLEVMVWVEGSSTSCEDSLTSSDWSGTPVNKMVERCSQGNPPTHHPDSTVNSLLFLLFQMSVRSLGHPTGLTVILADEK